MSSLSSQFSPPASGSGSDKRKASDMGPPGGSPRKKVKRPTPLEAKLETLQKIVRGLRPAWERHVPSLFMKEMCHTRDQVLAMTPNDLEYFIANECEDIFASWEDVGRDYLGGTPSVSSQPLERTDSQEKARNGVIAYAGRVLEGLKALVAQAHAKPAPCEFAASDIWRVYQEKPNAILCLRPAARKGLPIPLLHRAFCTFTRHFHEPCLDERSADYLVMAHRLCQEMPSAFDSEVARRDAFESIFSSLDKGLNQHLEYSLAATVSPAGVKESGARPDVAKVVPYEGGHIVLVLEEFKNEDGDIYMQICRAYEVLCGNPKVKRLVEFGNPVFLLCVLGPYFMVCGAIKRKNVHVEPLTPFLPMLPGYGIEGRAMQLAHCLRALKHGVDALQEFWRDVGVTNDTNEKRRIQGQHPNCPDDGLLRFDDWEGKFQSPIHDQESTYKPPCFLAKLRKADEEVQVVVKFVYNYSGTYGKATHEYLHRFELAPRLYSAVDLHRGLVMVVMEHLGFQEGIGGWVELDTFEKKLDIMAGAVRKKLDTIISCLQEQKMVHADLRPKNIMVQVDGQRRMTKDEPVLSVIDFDWSGTVGDARYPPFLNPEVPWPPEAKGYGKVGEDDDRILLNNWWGAFVQPAGSS